MFLQIISGLFLGYAIKKIKKQCEGSTEVDVKILVMHAFSFGLFMISIVVSFIFFAYFYLGGDIKPRDALITDIICVVCSFIAQVFLCGIIWTLNDRRNQ